MPTIKARKQSDGTTRYTAIVRIRPGTGMVRDAKHPRKKEGNHRRFKYTPEAWAVVLAQPRESEYFPYDPNSVSAAFTRVCQFLGIKDLRFHHLRHEATSRLFERGTGIVRCGDRRNKWTVRSRLFGATFALATGNP